MPLPSLNPPSATEIVHEIAPKSALRLEDWRRKTVVFARHAHAVGAELAYTILASSSAWQVWSPPATRQPLQGATVPGRAAPGMGAEEIGRKGVMTMMMDSKGAVRIIMPNGAFDIDNVRKVVVGRIIEPNVDFPKLYFRTIRIETEEGVIDILMHSVSENALRMEQEGSLFSTVKKQLTR